MTQNQGTTNINSNQQGSDNQTSSKKYYKIDEILVRISAKLTKIEIRLIKYKFFKDLPVVMRRFLIVFVFLFLIFFTSIVVLGIFFQILTRVTVPKPLPEPSPIVKVTIPPRENRNPSRYATDSEVLKLEEEIKSLDKVINDTRIDEPTLNPPTLNFDISF